MIDIVCLLSLTELSWDADPRERHTVWTQVIGQFVIWTAVFATNQMTIQRYLATDSPRTAQRSVLSSYKYSGVLFNQMIT